MATEFNFNGKKITLPGAYAKVESGVKNPSLGFSYGDVLIIDKDVNNTFGGGSGIAGGIIEDGVAVSGLKTVNTFDNLKSFRSFVGGGSMYDIAEPLFRPFGAGTNGISNLHYVRALDTTPATKTFTFTGGGSNGGTLAINCRYEGLCGNGVFGNETRATQTLTITNAGSTGDTIDITANGALLGTYTQDASPLSITQAAAALAATINAGTYGGTAHGYEATSVAAIVTISAPVNLGSGANVFTFVSAVTGAATSTVGAGTMAGGVAGFMVTRGFSTMMSAGTIDSTKFVLSFWRGTFTGNDAEGQPYGGVAEGSSTPGLIAQSPEFNNIQEVIDWAGVNAAFNEVFQLGTSFAVGTGEVTASDMSSNLRGLFIGGTQTYSTAKMNEVLDTVKHLGYTFVLSTDSGANALSVENGMIFSHLFAEARFQKYLVVGGGDNADTFTSQTIAAAQFYNSNRAIVTHGAVTVPSKTSGLGTKLKSSLWKAAAVLGRTAGLAPQTPVTFKGLKYTSEVHPLSDGEKELAIENGVLVTGYDSDLGTHVVVAGVNSLQNPKNSFAVNDDGTSHLISIERISAQLNKEIEINAKVQLLGNQNVGPNQATLTPAVVKSWVSSFLEKRTASATEDNLILAYQDITVEINQDSYHINYSFKPNFEVNKLFFTGLILDPTA